MKIECPICGSELIHEIVDDGIRKYKISKEGEAEEIYNNSDGYGTVYCSSGKKHDIPSDLINKVVDATYGHYNEAVKEYVEEL